MKIGITYDTKEDYGFRADDLNYTDFISLSIVGEIKRAIELSGHNVELIGNLKKLNNKIISKDLHFDLIFNVAEGINSRNREGLIPSLLEVNSIPYTGTDAYGLSLTLNKLHTKLISEYLKVPTPKFILIEKGTDNIEHLIKSKRIEFPVIIKPNCEGGSMGLEKIFTLKQLQERAEIIINKYNGSVICEEYISGTEITVPIIGNKRTAKAYGVVATLHEDGSNIDLYSSDLKHIDNVINTLDFECPESIKEKIMKYSLDIHKHLDLRDYSRMDFRLDEHNNPYFLEVNPLPSLCRRGSFEVCGQKAGLQYYQVIEEIISCALLRYKFKT